MNHLEAFVVVTTLAAVLAACGVEVSGDGADAPFELPLSDTTYDVDAPTWALDDTVHVGEKEITLHRAPLGYVVAEHGIYYTSYYRRDGALYFADDAGSQLIAVIDSFEVVKSADSRYLGLIDAARGPTDQFDANVAVPVVFDLETGEQILRPGPGRALGDDDLTDLYEDAELGFYGFAEGAAYAADPLRDGLTRFPLDGSDPETGVKLPTFEGQFGFEVFVERVRGDGLRVPENVRDGVDVAALSPGEEYLFEIDRRNEGEYYDARTGERISFEPGLSTFSLGGWLDDDTFYGATSNGARVLSGRTVIVSCETSSRKCTPLSEEFDLTNKNRLIFANGESPPIS